MEDAADSHLANWLSVKVSIAPKKKKHFPFVGGQRCLILARNFLSLDSWWEKVFRTLGRCQYGTQVREKLQIYEWKPRKFSVGPWIHIFARNRNAYKWNFCSQKNEHDENCIQKIHRKLKRINTHHSIVKDNKDEFFV